MPPLKCKFTELECTKNHDCDNCIVFWYGYYRDTGEIESKVNPSISSQQLGTRESKGERTDA